MIAYTFRNLESSEWLKSYATHKVAKLQRHLHSPLSASLTFSVERRMHCCDLSLQVDGETYLAREACENMYAAIDLVVDKLRQQLRRSKDSHMKLRRPA